MIERPVAQGTHAQRTAGWPRRWSRIALVAIAALLILPISPGYTGALTPSDERATPHRDARDNSDQRSDEAVHEASLKTDTASPTTLGGVAASAVTTSAATLRWAPSADAASGVDHYLVMLDGILFRSVTTTGTTLTGLSEITTYQVSIVAVDSAGHASLRSTPVSFTTQAIDRTPLVTTVHVTPASADGDNGWYVADPTVLLASSPATVSATTYYSWTSASGPWTPYLGGGLSPGGGAATLWYYSSDAAGEHNPATPGHINFRVDTVPPLEPDRVSAGNPGTSTVPVSWSGAVAGTSPIDHYDIMLNGTFYATTTSTSLGIAGLTPNASHSITVIAADMAGRTSQPSLPALVQTPDLDRRPLTTTARISPARPDGMNGWYVATPTVTLSSGPGPGTTTYYSWNSGTGPWATYTGPLAPIDGSNTLHYYSHDRSGQRTDETPKSTAIKFDPLVPAPTPALTAPSITHNSVTLSWLPVIEPLSGVDHYEVWDDYAGSTTDTQFTVGGLAPHTTYPFSIVTVNGAGTRLSSLVKLTVDTPNAPLPAAPASVLARAPGGGFAFVDWAPSSDVIGTFSYGIWRSADGASYSRIATVSAPPNTSYIDTGLRSSTRYWYAVSTIDSRGESPLSDTSAAQWPYIAPLTGRPERPTGVATLPGSNSVLVIWATSTNPAVTGYAVRRTSRSLSSAATTLTVNSVTIPPSLTDDTAVNGQIYYYSVCAVDASGTVGYPSVEITATPRAAYTGIDTHLIDTANGDSETCWTCHSVHKSTQMGPDGPRLAYTADGPNEDPLCLSCHSVDSGGSSMDIQSEVTDPLKVSGHPVWTTATPSVTMTCVSCHRPSGIVGTPPAALLGKKHSGLRQTGDTVCYECHGQGSTLNYGDMSGFENSGHANVPSPPSGSDIKCSACHEAHASRNSGLTTYAGYMVCMQCHTNSASNPNIPDIWSQLTLNSDSNSKHLLLPQDQTSGASMSCQNCHNTHTTSATYPLVDPHDPGPSGTWTTSRGTEKTFCFRCHDGQQLPTNVETRPWASAVRAENTSTTVADIKGAYQVNVHGSGSRSDPSATTAFLRPDMGYAANMVLECRACHEPHGSVNNYTLRQDVSSADGATTIQGLLVYKIPAGSITPGSPVGYDLRFFCSSCHLFDPATHDPIAGTNTTQLGKTDCTACHRHIDTDGTASSDL